jgi:hypothetical protein
MTAFSALTFGQDKPTLEALYAQFRNEIKAACGERGAALKTGKQIVDLYGSDDVNKEVIDFVRKRMTLIEKEDPACRRNKAYDEAFKAKNWAGVFTSGKEVIAAEGPTSGVTLDVMLDLISVGYDRAAVDKVDTFNAETVSYAKMALDRIQAGGTSATGKYGVFIPFNTKEDTQSWLNYIIGWQMYNKQNQQKESLTYFYKAAQSGAKKNDTGIYTTIGKFYFDEAVRLDTEYRDKRKANNNEDTDETKALLALARGTADRAADAFGRAYKIAAADPKLAQLKTNVAKTLTDLYKFRFNLADAKQADVDAYVNGLTSKPMPDPATAVTPVVVETPTTATNSTNNSTLNTTNAAATNSTQASTATTNRTATPAAKTPAKKPAPKKKGTR